MGPAAAELIETLKRMTVVRPSLLTPSCPSRTTTHTLFLRHVHVHVHVVHIMLHIMLPCLLEIHNAHGIPHAIWLCLGGCHQAPRPSEVLLRALRPRLGSERTWLESLNGLAEQECLTSQYGYVSLLRARNISFATSASLLEPNITSDQHVSTLTAGADCAGLKCHLNVQGHKVLAAGVSRWLGSECERGIQLAAAPVNPSSYTCRLAPFADLVAEQRGFAPVDPGEGRVRGLAALQSGDSLALWVRQQEGHVQVAFEQGWRNDGLARLSCRAPCKCAPLLLNASHPEPARRFTTITISSATWMSTDYSLGGGSICSVVIEVLSLTAGRLYLNALTVGGSITGNLGAAITQVVP